MSGKNYLSKCLIALITITAICFTSCKKESGGSRKGGTLPIVSTSNATNESSNGATLHGNISNAGNPPYTEKGFCYSTSESPTTSNQTAQVSGNETGNYSTTVSGLSANTLYYVRAYAKNSQGTAYGNPISFYTTQPSSLPVLYTLEAANVTSSSATLGGNISNAGSPSYYEKGVCYSTYQNPTTGNNKTPASGSGTGNFTTPVSGLTPNTTYYVRAYAINSQGTAYGSQISFKTNQQQTTTIQFYYDDGTAETGWRINPDRGASLGNIFITEKTGVITSVDIYGYYSSTNTNRQVKVNIYDDDGNLKGSGSWFVLTSGWQNITLPNIAFNNNFVVMVEWQNTSGNSHFIGIDNNGPFSHLEISMYYSPTYGWASLYDAMDEDDDALGPFLIRANANVAGKMQSFGPPDPEKLKRFKKPSINEVENIKKTLNKVKK